MESTNVQGKPCKKCLNGLLYHHTQPGIAAKSLLYLLPVKQFKCSFCDKKTYKLNLGWISAKNDNNNKLQMQ